MDVDRLTFRSLGFVRRRMELRCREECELECLIIRAVIIAVIARTRIVESLSDHDEQGELQNETKTREP